MSTIKVSALSEETSPSGSEELLINDGGTSKKLRISNLPANAYTHPNHSGEVTSTGDGATVIINDVVDEANLKISNAPTNGQFLSAQSGNTGGLTWAVPTDTNTVYTHPNHSGDIVSSGDGATTIQAGAVDIAMLSASGTASGTTFLRGDNSWVVPTDTNTDTKWDGGATGLTASTGRTSLGLVIGTNVQAYDADTAKTDAAQTFTASQRGEITTLTSATTVTPDFADSNNFTLTLGHNVTLANPTNLTAGQSGSIFAVQDGTGSRTMAFGSYWDFAGGTAPTMTTTASGIDRIDYCVRTTTSIHAVVTLALS